MADQFSFDEPEGRVISQDEQPADDWQYSLRPHRLAEYIGQEKAKENLSIFIQAALSRGEALAEAFKEYLWL